MLGATVPTEAPVRRKLTVSGPSVKSSCAVCRTTVAVALLAGKVMVPDAGPMSLPAVPVPSVSA